MKQPFKNRDDLHAFRMANCEGCDNWGCLFTCETWEAFSNAIRGKGDTPPHPIPEEALVASGYIEGQKVWPCAQFKDYGYPGFVPGVGQKEKRKC